jgi:hypothetical protein
LKAKASPEFNDSKRTSIVGMSKKKMKKTAGGIMRRYFEFSERNPVKLLGRVSHRP